MARRSKPEIFVSCTGRRRSSLAATVLCLTTLGAANAWSMQAELNEWELVQPQGTLNAVGGSILEGYHGPGGAAFFVSNFNRIHGRSMTDEPWIERAVVVDGESITNVSQIISHPTFPNVITAGVSNFAATRGVARSVDGGATWTRIFSTQEQSGVDGIGVAPSDPDIVYLRLPDVGMLKTTNGGVTWNVVSQSAPQTYKKLVVDPFDPDTVYSFDDSVLVRSTDGGVTFAPTTLDDIAGRAATQVAIDYANGGTVYAGSSSTAEVFKSVDSGQTWNTAALPTGESGNVVWDVAVDPVDSNHLYALLGSSEATTIFESVDAGATWSAVEDPRDSAGVGQLAFAADGELLVYASTGALRILDGVLTESNEGFNDFTFNGLRVTGPGDARWYGYDTLGGGVVSTDPFAPLWSNRREGIGGQTFSIHVNKADPLKLYVGGRRQLFTSQDGGLTWTGIDPAPFLSSGNVRAITVSEVDTNEIYLIRNSSLYSSPDGGTTWRGVALRDDNNANVIARAPILASAGSPGTAFVGTFETGVFATYDAGISWNQVDAGFSSDTVYDIEHDPFNSAGIYVATATDVWYSPDDGQSWSKITQDEGFVFIYGLIADPVVRGRIFVADILNNVRARDPRDGTWQQVANNPIGIASGGVFTSGELIAGDGVTSGLLFHVLSDIHRIQFDADEDGVGDNADNCILTSNPDQFDGDGDGLGNACDADIAPAINDCVVNAEDLGALRAAFFSVPRDDHWNPAADFNNDGVVNFFDLGIMRGAFFGRPGYSSVSDVCR